MKPRLLRMKGSFVKTQLQEEQQSRSTYNPLLVNERFSRSFDRWREQRSALLLVLLTRRLRMRNLGILMHLPLRVLRHHRPLGLGAFRSRRLVSSPIDDEGYIFSIFATNASFNWFESLCFSLGNLGIGCWLGVFLYIGIYICVLFVSIFLCLVHFAYLLASHQDMLFLMLLY